MIKIRVKNFQSIEEAEITIDGLTTITGKNNTGKSAFMRAIYCFFTNASIEDILKRGKEFLEVELTFNGNNALWKKGKKFNEYVLNGKKFEKVGKEVPKEILDLGIKSIDISGKNFWPQVALQIVGQVFLLDSSGYLISEAISDTSIVGKLSKAHKISEQRKKQTKSEILVREKDLISVKNEYEKYNNIEDGLKIFEEVNSLNSCVEKIESEIKLKEEFKKELEKLNLDYEELKFFDIEKIYYDDTNFNTMLDSFNTMRESIVYLQQYKTLQNNCFEYENYKNIDPSKYLDVPYNSTFKYLSSIKDGISYLREYRTLYFLYVKYKDYTSPEDLDSSGVERTLNTLKILSTLKSEYESLQDKKNSLSTVEIDNINGMVVTLEAIADRLSKIENLMEKLTSLLQDKTKLEIELEKINGSKNALDEKLKETEDELAKLVTDKLCPTCNRPFEGF